MPVFFLTMSPLRPRMNRAKNAAFVTRPPSLVNPAIDNKLKIDNYPDSKPPFKRHLSVSETLIKKWSSFKKFERTSASMPFC